MKQKIRLCIDARMVEHSGVGVYLVNYIKNLINEDRLFITLLGQGEIIRKIIDCSKDIIVIEFNASIYSVKEQFLLPWIVPVCDIFWSPHYNVPVLPIRSTYRIVTIHDVYHLAHLESLSYLKRMYAKILMGVAVRYSSKILTVSEFSMSEIIRFTEASIEKIIVIYSGIEVETKITDDENIEVIKNKYGLPDNYILFVGNVKPNKNLNGLVKAFEKITNNFPSMNLVITGKVTGFITGDPNLLYYIENSEKLKNKVIFTGFVERKDLPFVYSFARLFAFPSLYEGFGFPPLEAMACGCATVVSSTTSMPEICEEASYYVNPDDIDNIADGLRTVLTDSKLRVDLITSGITQYQKYDWRKSSNQLMEVINKVMAN